MRIRSSTTTIAVALTCAAALAVPATAGAATPAPTAPPTGFKAQSTDWLDPQDGFLLGSARCGDRGCATVLGTSDGGKTWTALGHPRAPIQRQGHRRPGLSEIRMGDTSNGWAFAPLLRHTSDGGRTWTTEPIPGDGGQVMALDTDADGTWAMVSPCAWGKYGACRKGFVSLWRTTTPTGTDWTEVTGDFPFSIGASVSARGKTVYVSQPLLEFGHADTLMVSTDGVRFRTRTEPCDQTEDVELVQVVARGPHSASMLCVGDPGFSKAVKTVYDTSDTGRSYVDRGTMGVYGIQSQLAAAPSGNLAVASSSDGSFIYVNDTGGTDWQMPVGQGDGGLGWNDIQFVTNKVAYVVYSPAGWFEPQGRLWVTHDAGETWTDVSPS